VTRSLVTGGSGYFGSLLVQRLRSAGHQVRILDLNDADDRPADVELVQGDIRNPVTLYNTMVGHDVVIHAAAVKVIPTSEYCPSAGIYFFVTDARIPPISLGLLLFVLSLISA
jgi:nucleoside-diphosphate-sugar epimerase